MKRVLLIIKWFFIAFFSFLIIGVIFIRFTRKVDVMLYQGSNFKAYEKFESKYKVKENFINVATDVKLHTALFKPDSINPIATILLFR